MVVIIASNILTFKLSICLRIDYWYPATRNPKQCAEIFVVQVTATSWFSVRARNFKKCVLGHTPFAKSVSQPKKVCPNDERSRRFLAFLKIHILHSKGSYLMMYLKHSKFHLQYLPGFCIPVVIVFTKPSSKIGDPYSYLLLKNRTWIFPFSMELLMGHSDLWT